MSGPLMRFLFPGWQGDGGLDGATAGALEAADAVGHVHFLVQLDPHRAPGAAQVAFHTCLAFELQMEEAPAVEQCQPSAQRTE